MYEIMFRGKRLDNKAWAEGCLLNLGFNDGDMYIIPFYTQAGTFPASWIVAFSALIVDPSTVCQYTGMPDKNSRRIFDGDIVRDMDGVIYRVVRCFTGFYLRYDPPHEHGNSYDLRPLCNYWHARGPIIEIIGNIFDNPELLKMDRGVT